RHGHAVIGWNISNAADRNEVRRRIPALNPAAVASVHQRIVFVPCTEVQSESARNLPPVAEIEAELPLPRLHIEELHGFIGAAEDAQQAGSVSVIALRHLPLQHNRV